MERYYSYKRKSPPKPDSNIDDLPYDPAKRKDIMDYHPNERDEVRRKYLARGPSQPDDHKFKQIK